MKKFKEWVHEYRSIAKGNVVNYDWILSSPKEVLMGYTIWPDGASGNVVALVYDERRRQDRLRDSGKFPWTCADTINPDTGRPITDADRFSVLGEEVGEVASIVTKLAAAREEAKRVSTAKLKAELIQVAAVCVAWVESLESR